ncbi:MAG: N-acetylmuramoyl-L-alanine amidase [Actinomycetota bacterium]
MRVGPSAAGARVEPSGEPGCPVPRAIRSFHIGQKGWPDIAYNFLIDRHGGVWEGRAGSLGGPVRGDPTGGNRGCSQAGVLIGDFTAQPPTEEAQRSLVRTLAWLAEGYEIDTRPAATLEFTSRGSNRWPEGTVVTTTPTAGHRDIPHRLPG